MRKQRQSINRVREMRWAIASLRELRAVGVDVDYGPDWLLRYSYAIGKQYGFGRWRFLRHRLHLANRTGLPC
jgi:hypothetical protein